LINLKNKFKKFFKKEKVNKKCKLTGENFELSKEEIESYKNFSLPLPNTTFDERLRRRLAFISSGRFFDTHCDKTGDLITSVHQRNSKFPVYKLDAWLDDTFDASAYFRAYNFDRTFNEQVLELWKQVPRPNYIARNHEDCFNINYVFDVTSCSNITIGKDLVNCHNSYFILNSRNCIDCLNLSNSENCYECTSCLGRKNLFFSNDSNKCENSYFLSNCSNCKNCIFCSDLKNAEYHIHNEKVSKGDYFKFLEELNLQNRDKLELALIKKKSLNITKSDFLYGCKSIENSRFCIDSQNISNSLFLFNAKNCFEGIGFGNKSSNLAQFAMVGDNAKNIFNSVDCWTNVKNLEYCTNCYNSHDLLACVGMSNKSFCILNKQYTENEYKSLRKKIIDHLRSKKTWGEFLPPGFCGLPYNLSAAQVFMPLSRAPAKLMGFKWDDEEENIGSLDKLNFDKSYSQVPNTIDKIINNKDTYICEVSAKEVKFNDFEIAFLNENNIAPPSRSIFQRQIDRVKLI